MKMTIRVASCVMIFAQLLCMNLAAVAIDNDALQSKETSFEANYLDRSQAVEVIPGSKSEEERLNMYEEFFEAGGGRRLSEISDSLGTAATKRTLAGVADFEDWLDRMNKSSSHGVAYRRRPHHHHRGRKTSEMIVSPRRMLAGGSATTIVVAQDGSGRVKTVQEAVNLVPNSNTKRVVIFVKKGIYREKVVVPATKPFITLKGEGPHLTYIEYGDTASTLGPHGIALGTKGSASVAVLASNFIATSISFRNYAPAPPGGAVGRQAVAFRIAGDMAAFYTVNFFGAQDTLYDHVGRHYFYNCYIQGSIDFVFGNGRSLYEKCHFNSIASPYGSIAAQHRLTPSEDTGFSIHNSVVTGSGNIYLGRAWGPASRVVYSFTYIADIILPIGWSDWGIPSREKTVFYGEYQCYGPGSNRAGRVSWSRSLTYSQAKPFLTIGFINGEQWL